MGLVEHGVQQDALTKVSEFRTELYACLTSRADALFDLCDALLCTDGPVRTLVDLALAPEHRRGHGALYPGINRGRIDVAPLRHALAGVPLPRACDGRLVLAVDVSPWIRPDADTCSDRVMRKPVPVPWICPPQGGRPPKHGGEFVFGQPETWGEATEVTVTNTDRYGTATVQAWDRLHPRLTRRAAWLDHEGPLPIIEGTVIRLTLEKLPSGGVNKPVCRRSLGSKNRRPATRYEVGLVLATGEPYTRPAHHKTGTKPPPNSIRPMTVARVALPCGNAEDQVEQRHREDALHLGRAMGRGLLDEPQGAVHDRHRNPEGVDSDEAPFDVSFHDQGVSVCVNIGYEAVVYDQSGTEVDCGHQRPLEVLRTWTESAEAAAQRTTDSSIVRTMREYAGLLRQALTQAEATDQQAQERPPSP